MFPQKIDMKIDESRYWEGLGKQEMNFHQVVGELIDNAISASGKDADGDLLPFTIEVVIKRLGNKVYVKVADQGIGMTVEELTKHILSPGGKGRTGGPLNEHGFGLKNALSVLTLGNRLPFKIQTRDDVAVRNDWIYLVRGPFSFNMMVELDVPQNWNEDLCHCTDERGTRVWTQTSYDYFNTLYKRARVFETLIERLGEHFGVMYRGYLKNPSNKLWLRWQDLGGDEENPNTSAEWHEERIKPIEIPYDINGCKETQIEISTPEGIGKAIYRRGNLDANKINDATLGWPYPLKIYYQASIPTQGIDIIVRGRVVKAGQLPEIWPEIPRHNDFNKFVGELILDENFRTVNNKIAVDPHNPFWRNLLEKLNNEREEYAPTRVTGAKIEREIKRRLKVILEGMVTGSSVSSNRPIWSGSGVKIDLYHKMPNDDIHIYEVKPETASPIDAYQLLMYWDGVVKDERKSPKLARLVAKEIPDSVKNIIEDINQRKDGLGNQYKFETKKIEELGA
jgi:hypothetical protein